MTRGSLSQGFGLHLSYRSRLSNLKFWTGVSMCHILRMAGETTQRYNSLPQHP